MALLAQAGPKPDRNRTTCLHALPSLAASAAGRVQPGRRRKDAAMTEWLKELWCELATELFDQKGLDTVFSHARNVVTGAVIVAAGTCATHYGGSTSLPGGWSIHFAGYVVTAVGVLLLLLNLLSGLRSLARRRHPRLLRALTILLYLGLSVRLAQVLVFVRAVM
jgi:hypothetical protein